MSLKTVAYGFYSKNLGWYGASLQRGGSYTNQDCMPLTPIHDAQFEVNRLRSALAACVTPDSVGQTLGATSRVLRINEIVEAALK